MAEELDSSEEPQRIVDIHSKRVPPVDLIASRVIEPTNYDDSAVAPLGSPALSAEEKAADYIRNQGLKGVFPTLEQAKQYEDAFLKMVSPQEQLLYTDTLLKYAETELPERKQLSVATRLEHFENSPEFKEASLKVRLSDFIKREHSAALADASREERKSSSLLGGAEAPNGLSRGEGNASVNTAANFMKAAENLGAAGSNVAGSVTGLLGSVIKVATTPFELAGSAAAKLTHKVKGDRIPRHETALQDAIDANLKNQAAAVEKIFNLPKDTPEKEIKPLLEEVEKRDKEIANQIRVQSRQGVNNALDDNLTEKQKRTIKSPQEVLEAGETNSEKRSSILEKLSKSPSLEGAGKEQLKAKAMAMAVEAAEMIKKMIDSIRNMFTQGNKAKASGVEQAAPAATSGPRM